MLHIGCCTRKADCPVDDRGAQAPLFHERPAQTRQHHFLWYFYAPLFNDFLRKQEDAALDDRLDTAFTSDPSVRLIVYTFLPQLVRSPIK
jgi:hypothetical protein